ncbi:MAG TPA: phage tail protein [Kofleriaceae bacterium]|nr:phage tail protein [Kofleriaceae bacterium]
MAIDDITATRQGDPFGRYNFKLSVDDRDVAAFKQCTGLDTSTAASEYREGSDSSLTQDAVPGLTTFSSISLKDGITNSAALSAWRQQIMNGDITRQDVTLTLQDSSGQAKRSWTLKNCWPTNLSGPSFDAASATTAIDELELAHQGIEAAQ